MTRIALFALLFAACAAPPADPGPTGGPDAVAAGAPDAQPYGTPPAAACSACEAPWHLRSAEDISWCELCPGDVGYHTGAEPGYEPPGGTWCAATVTSYFCDPSR